MNLIMKLLNVFKPKTANRNAIFTLEPYYHHGQWVFDDDVRGLKAEAFVCGMSEIIDDLLIEQGISPNSVRKGFRLTFSPTKFPDYTHSLTWDRVDCGGNWYTCDQTKRKGWLCPALFLFFPAAPKRLFAKATDYRNFQLNH